MSYTYDFLGAESFKTQTIKLGSKVKDEIVSNAEITFKNDIEGQVKWTKKGNDIIITAYKAQEGSLTDKVLGTITIKNVGTESIVSKQEDYAVSLATDSNENVKNFFIYDNYTIGDYESTKAQKLTGTYLDETFYGGYNNDTIKAVGGKNTVFGGQGDDKMYSGSGQDLFIISSGDAAGKTGDIIYGTDSKDFLELSFDDDAEISYLKNDDNLIIKVASDETTDQITVNKYFASSDRIQGINIDKLNINGKPKSANTLTGTEYDDIITGGTKKDTIYTGDGEDTIEANEGNDVITINGDGNKEFYMHKNDGNDLISSIGREQATGDVSLYIGSDDAEFSFTKNFQDLTITATYSDKTTGSVTLKNYFDIAIEGTDYLTKKGDFNDVTLNDENIIDIMSADDAKVVITGIKLSKLVQEKYGDILKKAGIKIPSGLTSSNIYLGTGNNDLFQGSNTKDLMVSLGGDNIYKTGKQGQTGILSLGNGNDTYNVNSFDAGTAIYDKDGSYELSMDGVNVNDIHMIKSHISNIQFSDYTVNNIKYYTDAKGLSNLASVNLTAIGDKLRELKSAAGDTTDIDEIIDNLIKAGKSETINSLLKLGPSAISKFKGVSVVTGEEEFEFDDIKVTDKKGVEQTISAESQEAIHKYTSDAFYGYLSDISTKYDINVTTKRDLLKLLFTPDKFAISKKDYNNIKKDFFNMYKTLYTGTSGDNKYTISKSDIGAAIASGTGSDTFTFNGNIGAKFDATLSNEEIKNVYTILSSFEEGDKDTISLKGYTLGKDLKFNNLKTEEGSYIINGATFLAETAGKKTGTRAEVNYILSEDGSGYDIQDDKFEFTLKDKARTYEVSAEHSSAEDRKSVV